MPTPFNPKFLRLEGFFMRWNTTNATLLVMSSEYDTS